MPRAFVIRPFGTKKDSSGTGIDFDRVHKELIGPALNAAELSGETTGEIVDAGNIREDMFALILGADLVVCDITILNANVFYELGIRHALRKKSTVMIKGQPSKDNTPFDLLTDRYLPYDIGNPAATKGKLIETITASLKSERETDSPIFQMLPALSEADPSKVQTVPVDFKEEVDRARKANSKGWLRLLSEEVVGRPFHWGGLKLVAKAQWDLNDWEGGRESWETIRETHPDDIDANLALANIYERSYRKTRVEKIMEASDQAIQHVINTTEAGHKERVEALALAGRNQKTRWRVQFDHLETIEGRRAAAMNRRLTRSYEDYRKAFFQDLNHFYSGLAAFQMGTILVDFSEGKNWSDAFDSDSEADSFKHNLGEEVATLRSIVPISIEAGLQRISPDDRERIWAEISAADVRFLTLEGHEQRVVTAYCDAIPLDKPFAWGAARGQLELFASLGVNAELAGKVISAIDARFDEQERKLKSQEKPKKPVHLIVFAGHRIDAPGRPLSERRFPPGRDGQAKVLIREAVEDLLNEEYEFVGLASAAPGADILAHEVCAELGLKSTICLPMPAKDYARMVFENLDDWRTRFLDVWQAHKEEAFELSDKAGLPRWLSGSKVDSWERGNRWVMEMALTWDAKRISLVALWDGKEIGDAPGGTAHMVKLARDAGTVRIVTVDAKRLLK
jgi:hypothetical protein